MEPILTIDIGGTAIKFGVADETGRFLQKGSLPTRIREKGVDAFLADLLSLVRRVRNAFPITGIAVSLAGIVAIRENCSFQASFFPAFTA